MIYSFFKLLKFIIVCLHAIIELLMTACVTVSMYKKYTPNAKKTYT